MQKKEIMTMKQESWKWNAKKILALADNAKKILVHAILQLDILPRSFGKERQSLELEKQQER